ncbi:MAG: hypothetical protein IJG41_09735 [Bacteroidales bacterium]|nr:hypothetical protein [Bacteroidales bacterium]
MPVAKIVLVFVEVHAVTAVAWAVARGALVNVAVLVEIHVVAIALVFVEAHAEIVVAWVAVRVALENVAVPAEVHVAMIVLKYAVAVVEVDVLDNVLPHAPPTAKIIAVTHVLVNVKAAVQDNVHRHVRLIVEIHARRIAQERQRANVTLVPSSVTDIAQHIVSIHVAVIVTIIVTKYVMAIVTELVLAVPKVDVFHVLELVRVIAAMHVRLVAVLPVI